MQESLVQFIWRQQAFDHQDLQTTDGQHLTVIHPGHQNFQSGPDFTESTLRLDGLSWKGNVEIHIHTSQWRLHKHQDDRGFNNVILHVVWENDASVLRQDGTRIPTLELKSRVKPAILSRISQMEFSLDQIPCHPFNADYSAGAFRDALIKNFESRMADKRQEIFALWHKSNFDWEQTAFIWLCRYLGSFVNKDVFELLGLSLPYKILQKHRDQVFQLEALLFGMAGLLDLGFEKDVYWRSLQREFLFLKHKYRLKPKMRPFEWKFLRMRPANFPTVRIAQLAGILHNTPSILNWILNEFNSSQVFMVSEYWTRHYTFGKISGGVGGNMGKSTRQSLWMNVVPPLISALERNNPACSKDAATAYHKLPAENTRITRIWTSLGVEMGSALDSQSYYALYTQACKLRKCLSCPVGIDLLRSA